MGDNTRVVVAVEEVPPGFGDEHARRLERQLSEVATEVATHFPLTMTDDEALNAIQARLARLKRAAKRAAKQAGEPGSLAERARLVVQEAACFLALADLSLRCTVALADYPPGFDGPVGDHLAAVLSDVASERARRNAKGYDAAHDDDHTTAGFEDHLFEQVLALDAVSDRMPEYRGVLVQLAALAVAAVERWDRLYLQAEPRWSRPHPPAGPAGGAP